jgi:hypothetical protein
MNGGIENLVQQKIDVYRSKPEALQKSYAQNQQLIDLLALQKIKSEKESAARQMQMQAQQNPQTVAQQREQQLMQMTQNEMAQQQAGVLRQKQAQQQRAMQAPRPPMPQGIAGVPAPNMARMATGGVVGFANGSEDPINAADIRGPEPMLDTSDIEARVKAARSMEEKKNIVKQAINAGEITPKVGGRMLGIPEDVMAKSDERLKPISQKIGEGIGATIEGISDVATTQIPEGTLFDLLNPAEYADEAVALGKNIYKGITDSGRGGETQVPTTPPPAPIDTVEPSGDTADSFGVLKTDAKPAPAPKAGGIADLMPTSTTARTGTGYKDKSIEDFNQNLITDADSMKELMGQFDKPELEIPGFEDIQTKYMDPARQWSMDSLADTPEQKARIQKMMEERQSAYDRINDPERNKRRALINRLIAAGGSRTGGNMFKNMATAGQRTENIQDRNILTAAKDMQDFELANIINPERENRKAATQYGASLGNVGLQQEGTAALNRYKTDAQDRATGIAGVIANQKAEMQGAIDLAKVNAQEHANLLTQQRNEFDKLLAQYRLTTTDMVEAQQQMVDQEAALKDRLGGTGDPRIVSALDEYTELQTKFVKEGRPAGMEAGVNAAKQRLDSLIRSNPQIKAIAEQIINLRMQQKFLQERLGYGKNSTVESGGFNLEDLINDSTITPQ